MADNMRPMPKVTPMPAPVPRANRTEERVWADEALRAAQRALDQVAEIERLTEEADGWRRRALSAEAECTRLEARIALDRKQTEEELAKRSQDHARAIAAVTADLDFHKGECVRVTTLAQAGASVFLQILDLKHKAPEPDPAGNAGLAAVAADIEERPMPSVVTAGPRNSDDA